MARRSYRGLVRFPGLGRMSIPRSVNTIDVVVGMIAGFIGGGAVNIGITKWGANLPGPLATGGPLLGGAVTAGALALASKKVRMIRSGHAIGALLGGAAVAVYNMLRKQGMPGYSGLVRFPGMGAPIFANPRMAGYGGPIFANPNTNLNLGRLATLQGMGDDNEDGLFPAP